MVHVVLDEVCGLKKEDYISKRAFNEHYKSHLEESYQCKKCPSEWNSGPENIFRTKKKLSDHIFEYHKNKVLECQTCKKTFTRHTNY